jgi:hypothetical protein
MGYQKKTVDLLIEALYGPEHLNISTSSGNKVDNDASTGMAWCDSRRDTSKMGEIRSQTVSGCTIPMCILFDGFRQI